MAMDSIINGGANTAGKANVDANFNLKVALPAALTQAGYAALATFEDAGAVTGSVLMRAPSTSIDERLSVGLDTQLMVDIFNYTAQNSANWSNNLTTMTLTYSGGYAFLNAGASLATGAFAVLKSYRTFSYGQGGGLKIECRGFATQTPQINNLLCIGYGLPGTTAAPTDGAYFQYSAAGLLNAVVNWNGTTLVSANLTPPSTSVANEFIVILTDDNAEFWINGILQANLTLPSGAGNPLYNGSGYAFIQCTNTGATGAAQGFKLASIQISQEDMNLNKPFSHQQAGMGMMVYQGQNGGTMGTTALFANSTNPTPAVPTNTTAALGTGLGGHFLHTNTLVVGTDGIISNYLNPVGAVGQTPRCIYITGIKIDTAVTVALAGGPEVFIWSLAFGNTALTLATAESAVAKAARRIALGIQTFGTASPIGTLASTLSIPFQSPICVNPGEYISTVIKNMGTVGTAGQLLHSITFDGYIE